MAEPIRTSAGKDASATGGSTALTPSTLSRTLDWVYDKAIDGVGVADSAQALAQSYREEGKSLEDSIDSLIRWQCTKAATSGFVNGLGGAMLMPLTIPANITSVMYVQVRMIAAIAHMCGYDLRDDRVKTLVFTCLCGNAAKDIVKELGIKVGSQLTEQALKKVSTETLLRINQAVGFKLVTKFGEAGAVNLSKLIPLVGGVIGATFDSVSTKAIGEIAKETFMPAASPPEPATPQSTPTTARARKALKKPAASDTVEVLDARPMSAKASPNHQDMPRQAGPSDSDPEKEH